MNSSNTTNRLRDLVDTEGDPFYEIQLFDSFFPAIQSRIELLGIVVLAPLRLLL